MGAVKIRVQSADINYNNPQDDNSASINILK